MKFLKKSLAAHAIGLLLCGVASQAVAADELSVTLGTKVWTNKWTSWDYYPPLALSATTSLPGASENFTSANQAAVIPSVTLRYADFLLTSSMFAKKSYGFTGSDGTSFDAQREETDVHAGYYLLPTLAVTLGYKDVKQDFGAGKTFKYSGPIVGVVASAPLTKGYSLYGNFGYGAMDAQFPAGFVDNNGHGKLSADYYLGEVGVAYSFDVRSSFPSLRALTATLGYRSQTLATRGFAVGTDANKPSASRSTELRDNTEGLALGLSVSF